MLCGGHKILTSYAQWWPQNTDVILHAYLPLLTSGRPSVLVPPGDGYMLRAQLVMDVDDRFVVDAFKKRGGLVPPSPTRGNGGGAFPRGSGFASLGFSRRDANAEPSSCRRPISTQKNKKREPAIVYGRPFFELPEASPDVDTAVHERTQMREVQLRMHCCYQLYALLLPILCATSNCVNTRLLHYTCIVRPVLAVLVR